MKYLVSVEFEIDTNDYLSAEPNDEESVVLLVEAMLTGQTDYPDDFPEDHGITVQPITD